MRIASATSPIRKTGTFIEAHHRKVLIIGQRVKPIAKHWKLIPKVTDILVTHGPAFGILDGTTTNHHIGCENLLKRIKRIKPKVHVFRHVHHAYGRTEINNTTFINASIMDE